MSEAISDISENHSAVKPFSKKDLTEQEIVCIDCKVIFIWSVGEQIFFYDKKLTNPPKRCKECKQAKNERLAALAASQAAGFKEKIEVTVTCAECSALTTVPFYPSQGRPVFCRTCYLRMNPSIINVNGNHS